jgi:hypothetical protein
MKVVTVEVVTTMKVAMVLITDVEEYQEQVEVDIEDLLVQKNT